MSKQFLLLGTLALVFVFAGCTQSNNIQSTGTPFKTSFELEFTVPNAWEVFSQHSYYPSETDKQLLFVESPSSEPLTHFFALYPKTNPPTAQYSDANRIEITSFPARPQDGEHTCDDLNRDAGIEMVVSCKKTIINEVPYQKEVYKEKKRAKPNDTVVSVSTIHNNNVVTVMALAEDPKELDFYNDFFQTLMFVPRPALFQPLNETQHGVVYQKDIGLYLYDPKQVEDAPVPRPSSSYIFVGYSTLKDRLYFLRSFTIPTSKISFARYQNAANCSVIEYEIKTGKEKAYSLGAYECSGPNTLAEDKIFYVQDYAVHMYSTTTQRDTLISNTQHIDPRDKATLFIEGIRYDPKIKKVFILYGTANMNNNYYELTEHDLVTGVESTSKDFDQKQFVYSEEKYTCNELAIKSSSADSSNLLITGKGTEEELIDVRYAGCI